MHHRTTALTPPTRPARIRRAPGSRSLVRRLLTAAATVVAAGATALAATVAAPVVPAASATSTTLLGYDVSWPQCPKGTGTDVGGGYGVGLGNPMPPTTTQFVVIGLTAGLPFTRNPCLASQVDFVKSHSIYRGAYTMAGYPTAAQLATYGTAGPKTGTTLADKLYNTGYAMAKYDLASMRAAGLSVPFVWIDVEPRPHVDTAHGNWPSNNTANNRQVLLGIAAGYQAAGLATGWYSYLSAWGYVGSDGTVHPGITGNWKDGTPMWRAGNYTGTGYDGARSICSVAPLNNGPIWMGQRVYGDSDLDATCAKLPSYSTIFGGALPASVTGYSLSATSAPVGDVSLTFGVGLATYQSYAATVANRCTGEVLRTWTGTAKGRVTKTWDGTLADGSPAPAGLYALAFSSEGQSRTGVAELVQSGSRTLAGCSIGRTYGADRSATSVALGRQYFPTSTTVVIAPSDAGHLVDGLVSAPLAKALGAPLLLTPVTALAPSVAADVTARHATTAYLVGSAGESKALASALASLGVTTRTPVAGSDRYATSVAVATRVLAAGGSGTSAFLAAGTDEHLVDALAAGGPAAGAGNPVLLTRPTALPAVVASKLAAMRTATTYVIGSSDAVSDSVAAAVPGAERLGGANRYTTALAVASRFADTGEVLLASGLQDHMVDGLPAGSSGRPLLLSAGPSLVPEVDSWLGSASVSSARLVGGPTVLLPALADRVRALLG